MAALAQFHLIVAELVEQFETVRTEITAMPTNTPAQLHEIMEAARMASDMEKTISGVAESINTLYFYTSASVMEAIDTFDKQVLTLRNVLKTPPLQSKNIVSTLSTLDTNDQLITMTYAAKVAASKPMVQPVASIKIAPRDVATKRYEIANGVTVLAYPISGADACKSYPGWLCHNNEDDRFYISINGYVISAITTDILDGSIKPVKFHELLPGRPNTSVSDCQFYVAAADYPGSKDRRILTNRAIYVPAAEVPKVHEKFVYRIGSRSNLKDDLKHMQKSDYRMLNDQTGNFLLCLVAATEKLNLVRS